MAYEASRDDGSKEAQTERANANNTKNIRNAADVAIASKNPYAMAAGGAVKAAYKVTGGKASEALGKAMTKANKVAPGGKKIQNLSNKASESGASDKIGQAARMKNMAGSAGGAGAAGAAGAGSKAAAGAGAAGNAGKLNSAGTAGAAGAKAPNEGSQIVSKMPDGSTNTQPISPNNPATVPIQGEGPGGSSPSSSDSSKKESGSSSSSSSSEEQEEGGIGKGLGKFFAKQMIIAVTLMVTPFLLLILLFVAAISVVTGVFSEYDDAFGMSYTVGEETGNLEYTAMSQEQQDFYDRIKEVKMSMQAQGKTVDTLKIVSIYHTINANNPDITYKKVTTAMIEEWANAMFDGNTYNETVFKDNLVNKIFPMYLNDKTQKQREELADEVLDYIDRYYNLIGKEAKGYSCAENGSCTYDVKGFSVPSAGNVVQNVKINNLKVRLMECGSPYGNGSDTKAIDQPLVNFEDYIAGVAYAEVGPNASEELLKAQMVAARSFALSRPAAMNNSAGKKLSQEKGEWVLQIASCVSDQVYCNIDEGCSYMGGGDGQGGIVRSGKVAGAQRTRDPLPANHPIRTAAAATQGEVLVNSQGYIIASGYTSADQNKWNQMANSGLNYKQILLQSYNQGNRKYGAKDVQKMSCSGSGSSNCISSGEFANWKQGDPQWGGTPMGNSGKTLSQIGCLATSVSMLIAKSGVPVDSSINPFNPGTFVQFLNKNGGFDGGGNFNWSAATKAAPTFVYKGSVNLSGMTQQQKLRRIQEIVSTPGVYATVEVKGNTGQHWVAIDSVSGTTINMMDPSTSSTDMWGQYNWSNTSTIAYYQVS